MTNDTQVVRLLVVPILVRPSAKGSFDVWGVVVHKRYIGTLGVEVFLISDDDRTDPAICLPDVRDTLELDQAP
jgi:hypothetical protein